MKDKAFPPLPYEQWKESKITLHLYSQIVGKIRLALNPKVNHWWHVPFYLSARGLTTSTIPYGSGNMDFEFDFVDHCLSIRFSDGARHRFGLENCSVADFYRLVMENLLSQGVSVDISLPPFDPAKTGSDISYLEDTVHASYDRDYVGRFFRILTGVEPAFKEFRGRFLGKCSPLHFFWHSFDLALSRFSGRTTPVAADADPVTREAYSHEVISAGFWPGDGTFREPAFYAYVHPEPAGLVSAAISPRAAWWQNMGTSHMALYRYEDFRQAADSQTDLLEFLQTTYEAGAKLAQWPRENLETSQLS